MIVELSRSELQAVINALGARSVVFRDKLLEVDRQATGPFKSLRMFMTSDEELAARLAVVLKNGPKKSYG